MRLQQEAHIQLELKLQAEQEKKTWQRLLSADFFKGFLMVAPTFLFGSFNFLSFSELATMLGNTINVVPQAYVTRKAKLQAYKKGKLTELVGYSAFSESLQDQMKKPAGINEGALHTIFRGMQETGITNPPPVDISPLFNPNPINDQRPEIFYKLKAISLANDLKDIDFAIETFKILYPEGYSGFLDPYLGLGQWGAERGLDVSHLSFAGGLSDYDYKYQEKLKRIKTHLAELRELQPDLNKRLTELEGTSSFLELQRLNEILNEVINFDYNEESIDKIIRLFGSISWEVLETKFSEIGEKELLLTFERNLYLLGLNVLKTDKYFDPYDSTLTFKINEYDNVDSRLLKTLLNIFYKFEREIVSSQKLLGNPLELTFQGDYIDRTSQIVEFENIGKIFGVSESTIRLKWLPIFELSKTQKVTYQIKSQTFLKLKKALLGVLDYQTLPGIYTFVKNAMEIYSVRKYRELGAFTMELRYIFSKYCSDVFSEPKLSRALSRKKNYVNKIKQEGKGLYEEPSKYFNLLNLIYCLDAGRIDLIRPEYLSNIREESKSLIFSHMVRRGLISSKKFESQFDVISTTLFALTIASRKKVGDPNILFSLTDLSIKASKTGNRKLLSSQFLGDYKTHKLKSPQIRRIMHLLRSDYYYHANKECKQAIDKLADFWKSSIGDYHRYFKSHLYIPQTADLLKLTLGLDVIDLNFIEDAKLGLVNYVIDVERAHMQVGKEYYLIFQYLTDENNAHQYDELIDFLGADFTFALGPLTKSSHKKIDKSRFRDERTMIAMARLVHLYQLLQIPYEYGKNYKAFIEEEFRSKTVELNGREIKLWEDLDDETKAKWIKRWEFVKLNPDVEDPQFFAENNFLNEFYNTWYVNNYLPYMQDFKAFLDRNPSCKTPDFWDWYLNEYLVQHRLP